MQLRVRKDRNLRVELPVHPLLHVALSAPPLEELLRLRWHRCGRALEEGELLVEAQLAQLVELLVAEVHRPGMQPPVHARGHVAVAALPLEGVASWRSRWRPSRWRWSGCRLAVKAQCWELVVEAHLAQREQVLIAEPGRLRVQPPVHARRHVTLTGLAHEGVAGWRPRGGWLRDGRGLTVKPEVAELLVEGKLPHRGQLLIAERRSLRLQPPVHAHGHKGVAV
mmetsp:Transcript_41349/g.111703  ORF Transcript_41349/g.111703 Transcript_41349/m.111703 type:complete len:224 (+) Transcript_41349:239-910(+)